MDETPDRRLEKRAAPKPVLIFCHMGLSSFVKMDMHLLQDVFRINPYYYSRSNNVFLKVYNMIRAFFHACWNVPRADMMYSYFAGYHCLMHVLIARFFSKPVVIMTGGFDTASVPPLEYGVFYRNNLLQKVVRLEYSLANVIGAVDQSLLQSTNTYADPSGKGFASGLLTFLPALASKVHVVEGAADDAFWQLPDETQKREGILFVAVINHLNTFHAKGGNLLLEIAQARPDMSFTLAGLGESVMFELHKNKPGNVTLLPFVSNAELRLLYQTHKVFALPSLSEGLPNVLCEAMLCGCIPVVSDVNGMPKAVGQAGFVIQKPIVASWIDGLENALTASRDQQEMARNHVIQHYSLKNRKRKLAQLFDYAKK